MTRFGQGTRGSSRHTAPAHRQAQNWTGDQAVKAPIAVVNGQLALMIDPDTLGVDPQTGKLVVLLELATAETLAGEGLEARNGKLEYAVSVGKTDIVAGGGYSQSDFQTVIDRLDELIGLMQDEQEQL